MPVIDNSSLRGFIPEAKRGRNIEIRLMDEVSRAQEKGNSASDAKYSVYGRSTQGVPQECEMQRVWEPGYLNLLSNALKDG